MTSYLKYATALGHDGFSDPTGTVPPFRRRSAAGEESGRNGPGVRDVAFDDGVPRLAHRPRVALWLAPALQPGAWSR